MARYDFNRYETNLKVLISNVDLARMRSSFDAVN